MPTVKLTSANPKSEISRKDSGTLSEQNPKSPDRMAWWREARFGMFIHWGLYSIPAGEWKGSKGHAEWIRETAHIPVKEYETLLPRFNPVKFNADEWARMAHDAGMRYIVITSKHHDGFCLFDSAYTDWDVMSTPFKRDILKELSAACKRKDVRFCTYHSIMDWHHPDYLPRRTWEAANRPVDGADFDRFNQYVRNEVKEIITKYDPGVMWFDGEWETTWTHKYGKPLYDLCLKTNPRIIVNNRVDKGRSGMAGMTEGDHVGDFGTPEQEIPATGFPGVDWESCITMNDHWGFNAEDKDFKSTKQLIQMLCDIASKGGNFLLNIGPRSDGTFPPESVQRLAEIGKWMRVNGESIYGTQAGPFKKLAWGRCTQKRAGANTTLYLQVFDWPKDGKLVVPGLGNSVNSAALLVSEGRKSRAVGRKVGSDFVLTVPKAAPSSICSVVALRVKGAPIVYETPEIIADAREFVDKARVELKGAKGLDIVYTTDGSDPNASNESNRTYRSPIILDDTTTVKARAYYKGKPVSGVAQATFTQVEPWHAVYPIKYDPGLRVLVYKGDWNKMPDFSNLAAAETFTAKTIDLGRFAKEEYVALRFEGFVSVDKDQMYILDLNSDDGGRLFIDGKLVVDNDGLHGPETKRGNAPLAQGLHTIEIEWFNKTGGTALDLKMAALGEKPASISPDRFGH